MAEAILKGVLGSLSSLIEEDLGLFRGFDQDLKRLASLLTTIMATLEDAEEKQFSNRSIKDWLQKLKDAAHELDDIMDEYAYEELGKEYEGVKCCLSEMVQSSFLSSLHPMHVFFRYKIAKRMKMVSERLDEIAEERRKFHLIETVPERRSDVIEWRQTSSFITEPQIYGREEDRDKIVDFLVHVASHSKDLSICPIVGLGGLGKTTLAQLIYNHERTINHFELRIWVCVSEEFKRWQRLKSILACGAKGASILVTTRLPKVAAIMGTMSPHELSLLSNNDCWALFKHHAFGPNEVEQMDLMVIGKEIAKKCGGVPLAAKALGGLLRFKRKEKEWLNVKESNMWSLPDNENSAMPALRLSYLNLPIKLRQCFAYCAIFPKDKTIRKKYLIELWMANGFISSNEILDAEDVGDGMWNELYWRSFFQDIETNEFGEVISFKMHDLVHDLAQFVAEEVCCITNDNDVTTTLSEKIHHLSNYDLMLSNSIQLRQIKSLRTYIQEYNLDQLSPLLLKCYSLRVLELGGRNPLSSSIGHLKHLRYLSLCFSYFTSLPESLCNLWNIQILKLDYCQRLQQLPNRLIHLKALLQLSLRGCVNLSSLPSQIGRLTSLKNLSTYIVGKERGLLLEELGQLKLRGNLHIKHMGRVKSVIDAKKANMSSKQLNRLFLSWDRNEESELQENVVQILEVLQPDAQQLKSLGVGGYKGFYFPQWMSSPSLKCLTYLKLVDCNCLELPSLGKLPSLKNLMISNMIHVIYLHEDSYDGGVVFMALEVLSLEKLPNLTNLLREYRENMFPCLAMLKITKCPKLLGLPRLSSINNLHIKGNCNQDLLSSIQKLNSLESLWLEDNEELTCFPDGMLYNLTSLKKLRFDELPNLEVLQNEIINLNVIQELDILYCDNLNSVVDDILQQVSHSLKKLSIAGCSKFNISSSFQYLTCLEKLLISTCIEVEGLHEALQHMTGLQSLELRNLPNLESLPDCFGNLALLHELTICYCSKLMCLPTSLRLSSLERLTIYGCPELEKRCQKETGEDWPKIAHIPYTNFDEGMFYSIHNVLLPSGSFNIFFLQTISTCISSLVSVIRDYRILKIEIIKFFIFTKF
uniref:Disease resistance protein RGA3 n=1 Tax=Cajanus cajan TaxID=3821 RepID=A0A151SNK7_CAJCA|nr:Putative disease resistance protein RGA3 [Cajanus cajan]